MFNSPVHGEITQTITSENIQVNVVVIIYCQCLRVVQTLWQRCGEVKILLDHIFAQEIKGKFSFAIKRVPMVLQSMSHKKFEKHSPNIGRMTWIYIYERENVYMFVFYGFGNRRTDYPENFQVYYKIAWK